jgi:hypothetical protein
MAALAMFSRSRGGRGSRSAAAPSAPSAPKARLESPHWSKNTAIPFRARVRYFNIPDNYTPSAEEAAWIEKLGKALAKTTTMELDAGFEPGEIINSTSGDLEYANQLAMSSGTGVLDAAGAVANNPDAFENTGAGTYFNSIWTLKAVLQLITMGENAIQGITTPLKAFSLIPNDQYIHYISAKYIPNAQMTAAALYTFPMIASTLLFVGGAYRFFASSDARARDRWAGALPGLPPLPPPPNASTPGERAVYLSQALAGAEFAASMLDIGVVATLRNAIKTIGLDVYLFSRIESIVRGFASTAGAYINLRGEGVALITELKNNRAMRDCGPGASQQFLDALGQPIAPRDAVYVVNGVTHYSNDVKSIVCKPQGFLGGRLMRASRKKRRTKVLGYRSMRAHLARHPPRASAIKMLSQMGASMRNARGQFRAPAKRAGARRSYGLHKSSHSRFNGAAVLPRNAKGRFLPRGSASRRSMRASLADEEYDGSMMQTSLRRRGAHAKSMPRNSKGRFLPRGSGSASRRSFRACSAGWDQM